MWDIIRQHPLFLDIQDNELRNMLYYFRLVVLHPEEMLIREGIDSSMDVFLILRGNLQVIKNAKTDNESNNARVAPEQFVIAELDAGDLFGELSFIKKTPRSASVKCIKRSNLLALNSDDIESLRREYPSAYGLMMKNLASYLASRLQKTTNNEVRALKTELENSILNSKANLFFSYVIGLLCVYNLTISKISQLSLDFNNASIVSAIIIVLFSLGLIFMIRHSDLPIQIIGLTSKGWRPAVKESLIWSVVIISFMIGAKWLIITEVPKYQHLPLFDFDLSKQSIGLNFILYTLHSPIQEFVARGVLQGSLQHFFSGRNVVFRAIIISNALFSATHVHLMEGLLGVIVFIPGLFWGWLYSRHNSLIGVSISHMLIGWTGLFFLDVESLF